MIVTCSGTPSKSTLGVPSQAPTVGSASNTGTMRMVPGQNRALTRPTTAPAAARSRCGGLTREPVPGTL